MRTLLIAFVGALSFVLSAQAQVEPEHRGLLKRIPPVDRDILFGGIRLDLPVSEVKRYAAKGRWTLLEETADYLRYETEPVSSGTQRIPYSIVQTFHLGDGMVYAISTTMRGSVDHERKVLWGHDVISAGLENRADSVLRDGTRRVMTHTTSDGRTMRVVWNQVSPTHAEIEAGVARVGQTLPPLR